MNFLKADTSLLKLAKDKRKEYQEAIPFPNIVLPDFFDQNMLDEVLKEFPDLSTAKEVVKFDNHNEKKLAAKGESNFGPVTKSLMHYLNSEPVLEFLQQLTGIEETLIPDPYFIGGGCHEIKPGGLLKVHADFNKNRLTKLDRRINLLVYLNKDWEESYGGHFELWNKDMTKAAQKILPLFNTVAIFSTTDFSYHGHPNPLTCPSDRSRKSLALYYYTNGRPVSEINPGLEEHSTLFKGRAEIKEDVKDIPVKIASFKDFVREFTPPVLFRALKKFK
jgi:hypothetical protein